MTGNTSIQISRKNKEELDKLKNNSSETYDEIVSRLIKLTDSKQEIKVYVDKDLLSCIDKLLSEMKQKYNYSISRSDFIEACIKQQYNKGINFGDKTSLRSMEILMGKYDH